MADKQQKHDALIGLNTKLTRFMAFKQYIIELKYAIKGI
jgi:hypothetical protein